MSNLEKILFREPLTGQEFIATREELMSSFLELSLMLRDPEEDGFVTINDLIDILNKNADCDLKKVKNESDFVWYRSLVNNDLIDAETIHALSLDGTRVCERLHYISKPVSRKVSNIDTFGWIHDTESPKPDASIDFGTCQTSEDGCISLDFNVDLFNSIKSYKEVIEQLPEKLNEYKLKAAANKIWDICKESPEMGNVVMDLIGDEAYQKVMKLHS